jgi:hypothetical protein
VIKFHHKRKYVCSDGVISSPKFSSAFSNSKLFGESQSVAQSKSRTRKLNFIQKVIFFIRRIIFTFWRITLAGIYYLLFRRETKKQFKTFEDSLMETEMMNFVDCDKSNQTIQNSTVISVNVEPMGMVGEDDVTKTSNEAVEVENSATFSTGEEWASHKVDEFKSKSILTKSKDLIPAAVYVSYNTPLQSKRKGILLSEIPILIEAQNTVVMHAESEKDLQVNVLMESSVADAEAVPEANIMNDVIKEEEMTVANDVSIFEMQSAEDISIGVLENNNNSWAMESSEDFDTTFSESIRTSTNDEYVLNLKDTTDIYNSFPSAVYGLTDVNTDIRNFFNKFQYKSFDNGNNSKRNQFNPISLFINEGLDRHNKAAEAMSSAIDFKMNMFTESRGKNIFKILASNHEP